MVRILVTGGAGFIGSNVCKTLLERLPESEAVVLDDLSTGHQENLRGLKVDFVQGSLLDAELVGKLVDRSDAVIHLAARPSVSRSLADPLMTHDVNVTGSLNVFEAVRKRRCYVVFASSSSVYGNSTTETKPESLAARPLSPYAASKLAAESYVLSYANSFGFPALAFRFFNVYGPGQRPGGPYAAVIPSFIEQALRRLPLRIYGDGRQTRDFTYVGTVAEVMCDAVRRQVECDGPVNLAFGTETAVAELAGMMGEILGRALPLEHVPRRVGDVERSCASSTLFHGLFGNVAPVDLRTGLQETFRWFERTNGGESLRSHSASFNR